MRGALSSGLRTYYSAGCARTVAAVSGAFLVGRASKILPKDAWESTHETPSLARSWAIRREARSMLADTQKARAHDEERYTRKSRRFELHAPQVLVLAALANYARPVRARRAANCGWSSGNKEGAIMFIA